MPSEERVREAGELLEGVRAAYRDRVLGAANEVRAFLAERGPDAEERREKLLHELGPFAAGRIDMRRLAGLLPRTPPLDQQGRDVVERALEVLDDVAARGDLGFTAQVPAGGDLRDVVLAALAERGRAFGAARVVELAQSGDYSPEAHDPMLVGYPFRRWTQGERLAAPPLVVEVRGEDLRPSGLGEVLQGRTRIALMVEGSGPPAALARLISPGVWVGQATSLDAVARLGDAPGPAVIAVFDPAEAPDVVPFVHDPRGGAHSWERVSLSGDLEALQEHAREGGRRGAEGAREELSHLLSLASRPESLGAVAAGEGGGGPVPEADRLAAWLLARTDLAER